MTPLTRVVTALEEHGCRREGDMWQCPAHEDRHPSLSVSAGPDGRVLLHCHAGCAIEDVLSALVFVSADLFDAPPSGNGKLPPVVARYPYVDEKGCILFEVIRYAPKDFRQRRPDGNGGWKWKLGDVRRVLYRLPQVIEAVAAGTTIYVVEGEKDVHAIERAGGVATCNPGGAGRWRPEYAAHLRGGHVVVVADGDAPGRAHAFAIAGSLREAAASVRVAEAAEGKDAADHLAAGHGLGDFQPAPGPVDARAAAGGAALLGDVHAFLGRFIAYPSPHAHVAHTLWTAHTHLMVVWESTPRLAVLSPEPGSGKTRALEVTALLVPRPVEAVNTTPAYLFRKIGAPEGPPTILYDEIDTVFGPKARDNEEIRAVLNAGHRRGAVAGRCVVKGRTIETEELPAYCAVALAGLGGLPDTILNRSVVIRMRRRAAGEAVEPFRQRVEAECARRLYERIAQWAAAVQCSVTGAFPEMPEGIEDRDADIWEALLSVADAAGGDWPARARAAALHLVAESKESTPSLGVRLLADLRVVFGEETFVSTEAILSALHKVEESPWSDLPHGPLNARGLAQRLRPYGVRSDRTRDIRGYCSADLSDAWGRYLP